MKKIIGLVLLAGSLAACQSTGTPPENIALYIGKLDRYVASYTRCVMLNAAKQGKTTAAAGKEFCTDEQDQLYKAAYSNAWLDNKSALESWKTATASGTIRKVDQVITKNLKAIKDQA